MKYIKEPVGASLKWSQPNAMIRYHELRSDGGLYATVKWKKMFGSLAVGECREGKFTLKRGGFLKPYVTVRKGNLDSNLAVMRFRSGSVLVNTVLSPGGVLEFEAGHRFEFNRLSFWKSRWAFTDESGVQLVTFDRKNKGKPSGSITLRCDPREIDDINVLLILGWYVIILNYEEEEAAVGLGMYAAPSNG